MANNRVFYACQVVAIAPCFTAHSASNVRIAHGVQSVGVTTNFNLEQAFELGMIQIYENIEGLPDVEVTLEKALDGYPLLYHLSSPEATSTNLVGRSKERACVALGIYADDKDAASGAAPVEVYMSGMYLSSVSYTVPTDGNSTESVTLVGNHKEWNVSSRKMLDGTLSNPFDAFKVNGSTGAGEDVPLAVNSGGIQRRENVVLASSELPQSIYGASGLGVGNAFANATDKTNNIPAVHVQNFTCSTDFSREDILELGRKAPYYRAPNFPIEVTAEFEVIAVSGDFVSCEENADANTSEEQITVVLADNTKFDLGNKNRLSSVSYGGGDAGGGNATITYSYTNFNDLRVTSDQDPAGL